MNDATRHRVVGWLLTVVVVAAVGAGILMLGSPAEERSRRLDERRVQDLVALAQSVDVYWTRHAQLPASLDAFNNEPGGLSQSTDPVTQTAYEYRLLESGKYELCATFETDIRGETSPYAYEITWSHGAGRQCFPREPRKIF